MKTFEAATSILLSIATQTVLVGLILVG